MTQAMHLLLSDSRGAYIPRDFVEGFDLPRFDGINFSDADVCAKGPDAEGYWDAWQSILDSATFTEDGHTFRLHQDGDLWAYCADLMTDDEFRDFFGEDREG